MGKHIHKLQECEGCHRTFQKRRIIWFCGHWLCGTCKHRKNMPLVGYKNKVVWQKHERKVLKRKRDYPFITWTECQQLWRMYMKNGLSESEAKSKIRSLRIMVRHNHWSYQKKKAEEPKKILPEVS